MDELELLIDEQPSKVELTNDFFNMKPVATIFTGLTSFFFAILNAGKRAKITYDFILLKFLNYVKRGTKFHEEKKVKC